MAHRRHDNYYDHDSGHHRSHSRGNGWLWFVAIGIAFLAYGGTQHGTGAGTHHQPSHKSTVCTKYFKGGC
jgi:hypothetical protein